MVDLWHSVIQFALHRTELCKAVYIVIYSIIACQDLRIYIIQLTIPCNWILDRTIWRSVTPSYVSSFNVPLKLCVCLVLTGSSTLVYRKMMMSKGLLISIFVLSCFAPSSFSKAQSFNYVSHDYGFNQIPPRGGTLFIKLKLLLHPNLSLFNISQLSRLPEVII